MPQLRRDEVRVVHYLASPKPTPLTLCTQRPTSFTSFEMTPTCFSSCVLKRPSFSSCALKPARLRSFSSRAPETPGPSAPAR
eukprot:16438115-Heterocapsa_arctica.AAC.1